MYKIYFLLFNFFFFLKNFILKRKISLLNDTILNMVILIFLYLNKDKIIQVLKFNLMGVLRKI